MVRVLTLVGAALLCALFIPVPDSPASQSSWAEGLPDLWARPKIDAAGLNPGGGYLCPMDRDVSSPTPGYCPRCGMKLVAGIADSKEYSVDIASQPASIKPGEDVQLTLRVEDPATHAPVPGFEIVHEKLYHFFIVSQDLRFFRHVHPELQAGGMFRLGVRLPQAGMYRVLSDFYPKGGTPQLVTGTLLVSGGDLDPAPAALTPDLTRQRGENMDVEFVAGPAQPLAGRKSTIVFRMKPDDGVEPYLGAWAHMLAASSDLIDMIHSHPIRVSDRAGAYKQLEFDMAFPRGGVYRVWLQSQRRGVVNTVAFNIPVGD